MLAVLLLLMGCGGGGGGGGGGDAGEGGSGGTNPEPPAPSIIQPLEERTIVIQLNATPRCSYGTAKFNMSIRYAFIGGLDALEVGKNPLVVKCR